MIRCEDDVCWQFFKCLTEKDLVWEMRLARGTFFGENVLDMKQNQIEKSSFEWNVLLNTTIHSKNKTLTIAHEQLLIHCTVRLY